MIGVYSKALEVLLKFLELAFSRSANDRKRLHDIEWEAEEGAPSVLGEVEVRADAVIGIVRTHLKRQTNNIDEVVEALRAGSIYESESIVRWIASDGDNFHEFLCYIEAIENLRTSMMTFLKNE
ncbi:hypothetical protein [Gynuella sunshinyii]|uniref:hypothetical protein n=1 Tax=Gynuella sunshinyii TaxID=1445505 RepID=UPI0005CBC504|nr:hypothetical protein [Gynuella sunshinyii]